MALSTFITYTENGPGGLWVLDTGQPDYADKREIMVPMGNIGKHLHAGEDVDRVTRLYEISHPNVVLQFTDDGSTIVATTDPHNIGNFKRARTELVTAGTSGALSVDCDSGNECRVPLSGNITSITVTNKPAVGTAQRVTLVFIQDTVNRTIPGSWTGVDAWMDGSAPVMPTGSGALLIVTLYLNGTETIGTHGLPT